MTKEKDKPYKIVIDEIGTTRYLYDPLPSIPEGESKEEVDLDNDYYTMRYDNDGNVIYEKIEGHDEELDKITEVCKPFTDDEEVRTWLNDDDLRNEMLDYGKEFELEDDADFYAFGDFINEIKKESSEIIKKQEELPPPIPKQEGKKESLRYNSGKLQFSQLDPQFIEGIIAVMMKGAEKYAKYNWTIPHELTRSLDSLFRHYSAFCKGEDNDKETGLNHLFHICTNCLIAYYQLEHGIDDRFSKREEE